MRDMVHTNPPASPPPARRPRLVRLRPWVQTAFLAVWLGPLGLRMLWLPSCVFHCYGCPLASFACPVGVVAGMTALHVLPLLAIGVVAAVAAMVGSLVCGWACPFGFLQDLLARVPIPRLRIPSWLGHGRYLVLAGMVVLVPYFYGESHLLYICRLCPAGTLEAALPSVAGQAVRGQAIQWMSGWRLAVLGVVLGAALLTHRPWCTVLCPLGGFLSLFNRVSVLHLRFDAGRCIRCNTCRSRCSVGVKVDQAVNTSRCIRCLECTTCGALAPSVGSRGR